MHIINCEQNSPEWFAARCGVPSSSCFDMIVTTKGEPSKQRTKYLYKLAGERICGKPEETYQSAAMARGNEMQDEATKFYELINDVEVRRVGFCVADYNLPYGSSPDGLVGEDGGIEIKCPSMATHVGYLIDGSLPSEYFQQVQGELLVTGRKWFDFISYYPGIKPFIIRVERDEPFLRKMESEIKMFVNDLESIVKKIR